MSDDDYSRLIEILTQDSQKYNAQKPKHSGNNTTIQFTYNGKSYTFNYNKNLDTSALEKSIGATRGDASHESVNAFEKIIQSFAKGELHQGDLVKKLEPFGFTREQIETATKYDYKNDAYEITLTYGNKEYKFNCNIAGANDGTSDTNLGETYTLINPSEIKNQGLTNEQIDKYFVKAVVINGQVQYYAKNKNAWQSLGLKTTDNISALKAAVKRSEDLQHITDLVNEVITNLSSEYQLTSPEVQQLRDYLHGDSLKSRLEGMIGKTDDQIKNSVTSLAKSYITGTIRKAGTKGAGSVDTSSLTDAQVSTINSICNAIVSALGINLTTLTDKVKAAAVDFASATDFEAKVQEKALDIAQGIFKESNVENSKTFDEQELYNLVNDICDHIDWGDYNDLVKLQKYLDKVSVEFVPSDEKSYDGSPKYFEIRVSYTDSTGSTVSTSGNHKFENSQQFRKDIEAMGYSFATVGPQKPSQNTYIQNSVKAETLLEICRGFMKTNTITSRPLTFEEAMDVFNKVKVDTSYTNTYTNIYTFKNAVTQKANDKAKEKVKNTPQARQTTNDNAETVDFDNIDLSVAESILGTHNFAIDNGTRKVSNNTMYIDIYDIEGDNQIKAGRLIIHDDGRVEIEPEENIWSTPTRKDALLGIDIPKINV